MSSFDSPGSDRRNLSTICLAALVLLIGLFSPRVISDGAFYYEYLRSAVADGDLNFLNEHEYFTGKFVMILGGEQDETWTKTGYIRNIFAIGPPLSWLPVYLPVHVFLRLVDGDRPQTGYEPPYLWAVGLLSVAQGVLGLLLTYRLARRFFSPTIALDAVLCCFLASPLPAFMSVTPTFPHAFSFPATALYLLLWVDQRQSPLRPSAGLSLGLAGGLAALGRWQNGAFLLLPALDYAHHSLNLFTLRRYREWLRQSVAFLQIPLGVLIALAPQLTVLRAMYGSWATDPQNRPLRLAEPLINLVLFHPLKGFFVTTPLMLIAALGLVRLAKTRVKPGAALALGFLLQVYLNSIRYEWSGTGFGLRRFSECVPILALGLAALLEPLYRRRLGRPVCWVLGGGFAAYNLLLMAQYYLTDYGDPWPTMSGLSILRRQLTLAPRLLPDFLGTGYIIGQLGSSEATFAPIGRALAAAVGLTTVVALALWTYRRLASRYGQERGGASSSAVSPHRAFCACTVAFIILVEAAVVALTGNTRSLCLLDLGARGRDCSGPALTLGARSPFSGAAVGLRLSAEGIAAEQRQSIRPSRFLDEVQFIDGLGAPEASDNLRLPLSPPRRALGLEFAGLYRGTPLSPGTEIAEVRVIDIANRELEAGLFSSPPLGEGDTVDLQLGPRREGRGVLPEGVVHRIWRFPSVLTVKEITVRYLLAQGSLRLAGLALDEERGEGDIGMLLGEIPKAVRSQP